MGQCWTKGGRQLSEELQKLLRTKPVQAVPQIGILPAFDDIALISKGHLRLGVLGVQLLECIAWPTPVDRRARDNVAGIVKVQPTKALNRGRKLE